MSLNVQSRFQRQFFSGDCVPKDGCNEKQNRYNFDEEKLQFWKTEIVSKSGHVPKKEKTCSGVNQFWLLRSYKILL